VSLPHISVCICTYQRPDMLLRLLRALEPQRHEDRFSFSIVVADNDRYGSARKVVDSFRSRSGLSVTYCSQTRRNIALTRNAAIAHASGDFIAFIDDDEFPAADWLLRLYMTLAGGTAAAVLGPVRPHFESPPPQWVVKGRFCERPEYPTGTVIHWQHCRTGNVLFRRSALPPAVPPFREEFGTGGEDKDFFMRRALLRGKNSLRINNHRLASVAKSSLAVPSYTLLLPFAIVQGQDRFMHLLIRLCDHAGKLLALVGLNPVSERSM
jgi:succinoglycan biosynthesis protein ExoM